MLQDVKIDVRLQPRSCLLCQNLLSLLPLNWWLLNLWSYYVMYYSRLWYHASRGYWLPGNTTSLL